MINHPHTHPKTNKTLRPLLARAEAAWAQKPTTRPEVIAMDVEWRPGVYGALCKEGFGSLVLCVLCGGFGCLVLCMGCVV